MLLIFHISLCFFNVLLFYYCYSIFYSKIVLQHTIHCAAKLLGAKILIVKLPRTKQMSCAVLLRVQRLLSLPNKGYRMCFQWTNEPALQSGIVWVKQVFVG